jgi:hypothetical protein
MASPLAAAPAARSLREPAVVTPGRNTKVRSRIRVQWLVLAVALMVLAGVLVAWALTRAADRVAVVSVARPVAAGTVIGSGDLTTVQIAFDGDVTGLVPATSIDSLAGRVATVDLQPGTLLSAGMWADGTGLAPDERTVGAVLEPGRFPTGLAQGASAVAVPIDGEAAGVTVRVVDADTTEPGDLSVTLAVPEADAARLAQLAASERLVLVGLPAAAGTTEESSTA